MDGISAVDRPAPALSVWGVPLRTLNLFLLPCFLLLVLLVVVLSAHQVYRGLHFDTDLRALLPGAAGADLPQAAADRLLSLGGERAVLMVAADNAAAVRRAATSITRELETGDYWRVDKNAVDDSQFQQFVDGMKDYRFHLLGDGQKARLQRDSFAQVATEALHQLHQPAGWARVIPPSDDPLGLFGNWLSGRQPGATGLSVADGYVLTDAADAGGRYYGAVLAELLVNPFSLDTQQQAVAEITAVFSTLPDNVATLRSGVLFHAARAAAAAKREMRVIGLGSVIGIVLLYLLSFRSLWPLGLSLSAILFGSMAALAVVHTVFGSVHLITLVFGAALIGVAVDYALHFLSRLYHTQGDHTQSDHTQSGDAYRHGRQVTPQQAIAGVFPGITLALLTTIIGYLCLLQSDMPGLYQIALFSIVGLVAAWLFVLVLFPRLTRPQSSGRYRRLAALSFIAVGLWQKIGRRRTTGILLLLFPLLLVLGVAGLQFSKDARTLYLPAPALLDQARTVQRVLGAFAPNQFFVVSGADPQAVLEAEEAFQADLDQLIAAGAITAFDKVSNYLPSIVTQRENYRLLKDKAYGPAAGVAGFMSDLGVATPGITAHLADFSAAEERYLTLSDWVGLAPAGIRGLWLEGRAASIITLTGIEDVGALRRAAAGAGQVLFVDRVADISHGLLRHSHQAAGFLLLAYGLIALLLLLRYRRLSALLLVSIPLLSSLIVLVLLSGLGIAISLFHLFGLFLVLGLGMDYGLFIRETAASSVFAPGVGENSQWIAINLSAITSCLSFGLMSLSSTPMVGAFGTVVLIGSLCNLLLVPVVAVLANEGDYV